MRAYTLGLRASKPLRFRNNHLLDWGKRLAHSFTSLERLRQERRRCSRADWNAAVAIILFGITANATAQSESTSEPILFDIPALRADLALTEFAEQADLTLVFRVNEVREKQANALRGRFTLTEGVNRLLEGTGLNATLGSELVLKIATSAPAEPEGKNVEKDNRKGLLAAIAAVFIGSSANAQDASGNAPRGSSALEEIVVTAQKREERVQSIPLAITALDQARLARAGVTGPERLEFLAPNLTFAQSGSAARFSLRGVSSSGIEVNADPVVGMFVDGVYQSRTAQAMAGFVDIERVEVVRGPQGTLYGRNTTGGSINIISKAPSTEGVDFGLQSTVGDFSHFGARGFVNVPVNDRVAVRIAGLREVRDGWAENLNIPDETNNDEDQYFFRGSVLVDISERAELVFRANYWSQEGQGAGFNAYKVRGTQLAFDGAFNFENNFSFFGTGGDPNGNPSDPYEYSDNLPASRDIEQLQASIDFSYEFEAVTLRSITSLNEFDRYSFRDADFLEVDIFNVELTDDVTTFTQEFQITSNSIDPVSWVIGTYFLQDDVNEHIIFGNGTESAFFAPGTDFINRRGFVDTTSFALFGQATWAIRPDLRLTGGIRWTEDEKEFSIDSFGFAPAFLFEGDETFSEVTWRAAVDYDASDNTLLYGYITKGFKSGGINLTPNPPFDNETVIAYEIGLKRSIDNLGFVNIAAFYSDFEDLQVNSFDPDLNSSFVRNAAEATVLGVEVEGELRPGDYWSLTGSVAYQDATYDGFIVDNPLAPGVDLIDLSDNRLPRAPEFSAKIALSRDFVVAGLGTITPIVQFSYFGDQFHTEFNQALDKQDSYSKTDFRLFWQNEEGRWSAEAFVTNIEDEAVLIAGVYGPGNTMFANYGAPRTFGFRLGYNY